MAVYSPRYNYIFFANPQTASKAIARTLQEAGLMTREQLDRLFKFTSVRNPYDLLVSRYLKRKGRFVDQPGKYRWAQDNPKVKASMEAAQELSFPEWLAGQLKRHTEKDKTVKGPLEYLDHADYVIRFEALQAGFDEVLQRLGIDRPIPIVSENVTSERAQGSAKRHYTEFYDDASRDLVARAYAPIIERFDYRFG